MYSVANVTCEKCGSKARGATDGSFDVCTTYAGKCPNPECDGQVFYKGAGIREALRPNNTVLLSKWKFEAI